MTPDRCYRRRCAQALMALVCMCSAMVAFPQSTVGIDWRYTVRPQDSLSSLARQYLKPPFGWQDLVRHNRLHKPNALQVGTQLRIPLHWLVVKQVHAQLTTLSGDVQTQDLDGTWRPAQAGELLQAGQQVKVGTHSSARLLFADASELVMQPQTALTLDTLSIYAGGVMVDTQLRLPSGRVEVMANPQGRPGQKFDVTTPAAVASVRGTQFMVDAQEGRTVQQTNAGQVALQTNQGDVLVPQGFGSAVRQGEKPSPPEAIKPAPTLQNPVSKFVKFPIHFHWVPQDEVTGWVVQVARDPHMAQIVLSQQVERPFLDLGSFANGTYHLRAWSIDPKGMPSQTAGHAFVVAIHRQLQGPAIQLLSRLVNTAPMAVDLPPLRLGQHYWVQVTQDPEGRQPVWHQAISGVTFAVPVLPAQDLPYHLWIWVH